MKNTWNLLRDQFIAEGISESSASKFATNEMNKRRKSFKPEDHIFGMLETDAATLMNENGYILRVREREGVGQSMNLDYRPNRYNVIVWQNKVVAICPKWTIG